MIYEQEPERPKVLSVQNFLLALAIHVGFVGLCYLVAVCQGLLKPRETVIPIDLMVVVNENPDGNENEPPPLVKDTPPPEKPKPPKLDIPDAAENLDAVVKVLEKKKPPKKPEKKPEKKDPPKPPEKTPAELRAERIKRMRDKAKTTKNVKIEVPDQPSGNGRTTKKNLSDEEVRRLLAQGYKAGASEQLATSEAQRCASLIKMALDRRWNELSPSIDREGVVILSARFSDAGRLEDCRIVKSCGSAISDRAALQVASTVGIVRGLSPTFIAESRRSPVKIYYRVEAR